MKKEPQIELLQKVERVDAPPFLLTRIHAKIRAAEAENMPVSWKWAGSLAFTLLIVVNFFVVQNQNQTTAGPAESLVSAMKLQNSNQLYND